MNRRDVVKGLLGMLGLGGAARASTPAPREMHVDPAVPGGDRTGAVVMHRATATLTPAEVDDLGKGWVRITYVHDPKAGES